ncbi:MAG: hypothetical protein M1834_007989 [Cirrosporium novae-zelandiae]|nr:MAG: hypothetical protein M1834_007989 [Cirrosporium novae-zelandiae]
MPKVRLYNFKTAILICHKLAHAAPYFNVEKIPAKYHSEVCFQNCEPELGEALENELFGGITSVINDQIDGLWGVAVHDAESELQEACWSKAKANLKRNSHANLAQEFNNSAETSKEAQEFLEQDDLDLDSNTPNEKIKKFLEQRTRT